MTDPIKHTTHYNWHPSGIECKEITYDLPTWLGSAIKYIYRRNHKGQSISDRHKAIACLSAATTARLEALIDGEIWTPVDTYERARAITKHPEDKTLNAACKIVTGVYIHFSDADEALAAIKELTERLQAEITQLETEAFEVGKKEAITSLVYIIEGLQQDGETDQNMAYVPGETGRKKAKETWEEFLENPALYISEKIAPSIIGATYTTVIEESEAHIQGKQAEAWAEGYQDGKNDQVRASTIEHGIDKPSTNPYKENN